jgi:hypothetical protein
MIGPSDIQIILGKVRPLSRPLTEAHPQVLIIARADEAEALYNELKRRKVLYERRRRQAEERASLDFASS